MSEEQYLGGFSSFDVLFKGKVGYGIHATSKKLLIVKNKKSLLKAVLPILVGGDVVMVVAAKLGYQWGRERNEKIIKELEEKDFRNPQQ